MCDYPNEGGERGKGWWVQVAIRPIPQRTKSGSLQQHELAEILELGICSINVKHKQNLKLCIPTAPTRRSRAPQKTRPELEMSPPAPEAIPERPNYGAFEPGSALRRPHARGISNNFSLYSLRVTREKKELISPHACSSRF